MASSRFWKNDESTEIDKTCCHSIEYIMAFIVLGTLVMRSLRRTVFLWIDTGHCGKRKPSFRGLFIPPRFSKIWSLRQEFRRRIRVLEIQYPCPFVLTDTGLVLYLHLRICIPQKAKRPIFFLKKVSGPPVQSEMVRSKFWRAYVQRFYTKALA